VSPDSHSSHLHSNLCAFAIPRLVVRITEPCW
jgi:hypothetical protein